MAIPPIIAEPNMFLSPVLGAGGLAVVEPNLGAKEEALPESEPPDIENSFEPEVLEEAPDVAVETPVLKDAFLEEDVPSGPDPPPSSVEDKIDISYLVFLLSERFRTSFACSDTL